MTTIELQRENIMRWVLEPQRAVRGQLDAIDDLLGRRELRRSVSAPSRSRGTFRRAS